MNGMNNPYFVYLSISQGILDCVCLLALVDNAGVNTACVLSRVWLYNPIDCSPPGSCPWDFPGKNMGVCYQGIFPTQGLEPVSPALTGGFIIVPPGKLMFKYPLKSLFSLCLYIYPELEWLDHMLILFLSFWGTTRQLSTSGAPSSNVYKGSNSLHLQVFNNMVFFFFLK